MEIFYKEPLREEILLHRDEIFTELTSFKYSKYYLTTNLKGYPRFANLSEALKAALLLRFAQEGSFVITLF